MRVVIDGLPITGNSTGIVVEHLLSGWSALDHDDELHLVLGPDAGITVPDWVTVHREDLGPHRVARRIVAQSTTLPRLCRQLHADVMLGVVPATTMAPLPCPRAVIAYDLRYQLRRRQFPFKIRLLKRVSYDIGYRQTDGVACISARTKRDLLATHPYLRRRAVEVTHLGADHVQSWPRPSEPGPPYAVAFGQYANKNVDVLLDTWALLHRAGDVLPLRITGLTAEARAGVERRAQELGVSDVVAALPWLDVESFQRHFAGASLVVFPSDFEGFGLPAVEAMRLGIPVAISAEETLLEVTGGHASVMDGDGPEALARAVERARGFSEVELKAAQVHAETFTWSRTAAGTRALLQRLVATRTVAEAPAEAMGQLRLRAQMTSADCMPRGNRRSTDAVTRPSRGQGSRY